MTSYSSIKEPSAALQTTLGSIILKLAAILLHWSLVVYAFNGIPPLIMQYVPFSLFDRYCFGSNEFNIVIDFNCVNTATKLDISTHTTKHRNMFHNTLELKNTL